jgi:hypothetical protein
MATHPKTLLQTLTELGSHCFNVMSEQLKLMVRSLLVESDELLLAESATRCLRL